MMLDKTLLFSDHQAITVTADSENRLDLGAPGMDKGGPLPLFIQVTKTFTDDSGTDGTLTVALHDSADDSSYAALSSTGAIPVTALKTGYRVPLTALPPGVRRYVKLVYTVADASFTQGNVSAGLTLDAQTNG